MNSAERGIEFTDQILKRRGQRRPPPDQNVIMAGAQRRGRGLPCSRQSDDFPQSAADPVSLHGVAHLFRHRKADARRAVVFPPPRLQHECAAGRTQAGRDGAKLAPAFQPLHGKDTNAAAAPITRSAAYARACAARPKPSGRPW